MKDKDYTVVDIEKERLIENDLLARGYEERLIDGGGPSRGGPSTAVETHIVTTTPKYTSKATLHIQSNRASNVDDPIPLADLESSASDKKTIDANTLAKVVQHSKYQVIIPTYPKTAGVEEKKMDENGNALHQTKEKKKKKQSDKNVVVLKSENIEGHKSEIINNVDQLLHYIEGTKENNMKTRPVQSKSKQLHKQHASEDGGSKTGKKRHPKSGVKESRSNVALDGRHELKKSNSLSEISGMKLDREFEAFGSGKNKQEKEEENVVLRGNKPSVDRTRERRSWGNVEPHSFQTLYNASSLENLETSTDNWEVTRPKKKSKKRRNSLSSASGARQNSSASGVSSSVSNEDRRSRRAPSPDLGIMVGVLNAKTTRSMPHSEKSNDSSSDVDSVHSLPMDGPISYADIAKNSEKKKPSPEKQERPVAAIKEKSPQPVKYPPETESKTPSTSHNNVASQSTSSLEKTPTQSTTNPSLSSTNSISSKSVVPDVHNIKSFPAITGSTTKTSVTTTASPQTQNVTTTSDKAVQSTLSYEETFVREKTPTSTQKSHAASATLQSMPIESSQSVSATTTSGSAKRQSTPNNSNPGKEKRNKASKDVVASPPNHTVQGFFGAQGDVHNELSLDTDDFDKLYKLHTGHHVFNESDDGSSLSETESKDSDMYKPPLLTYEELTSNLVDYKPENQENECTNEQYSNEVQIRDIIINKELEKLISKTYCQICNIHNQTEHNIASHIRGQLHKNKLEEYRRNRWIYLSKDERGVLQSHESGSVHTKSYTSNKVVAPSNPGDFIINKELEKLVSKTSCHICNIHNQTEHNIASHIRGQSHKNKLEEYRRNRWTNLSKDARSVQQSHESGSIYTKSHTSNKVVAPSNSDTCKLLEEVIQEKMKKLALPDYCYICEANLEQPLNADSHYRSKRHKDNLKLWKCEELSKMKCSMKSEVTKFPKHPAQDVDEKSTTTGIVQNTSTKSSMDCYICGSVDNRKDHYSSQQHLSLVDSFCFICNVQLMSKKQLFEHVNGAKHMNKIKQIQNTQNTAISSDNIVKADDGTIIQGTFQFDTKKSLPDTTNLKMEICAVCNLRFSDSVMAKAHYNTENHKLNAKKSVLPKWCYCEICKIPMDGTEKAEDHYISGAHIAKTIKYFSCKLCNLEFYAEELLQKHKGSFPHCYLINLKHDLVSRGVTSQYWYILKETKVECTLCGIYMMSPSNATAHLNSHRHLDSLDNWVCAQIIDVKNPNMSWYYCYICDVKLDGTTLVELHYQGKSHLQKKREIGENATKLKDITQQVSGAEASKDALENSKKTKRDSSDYLEAPLTLNGITSPLSGDLEVNSTQTIDSFKTINDLEETTNFSCYLCNIQFVSEVELLAHMKDYPHSQLQILKKDLIIYGIDSKYWSVSNEKDIICLLCYATLQTSSSAQQHIQSSKHSKKYTGWLEKQERNAEDVNRRSYYCDLCATYLDGTSHAERHYQGNYHIENLSGCNKNMQWFLGGVEQEGDSANLPEEIKDNVSDMLNETNNKDQVTSYVTIEIEEPIEDVLSEDYNFKCYLCKMEFESQDDLWDHCKIFPHKHVINMKSYIVSKGISRAEYWTSNDLSVNCILCSVNLQNDSAVNGHLNSKKHNSRLNTWLKNQVADTMDPNRKWFYCDVCNVNLDGTSNAENHNKEESHIRRTNGTSDSEGTEVMPTNCTGSGLYPGSSVVRYHSDIVVVKPNSGETHEETILLKDEVLSELEEFTNIIYFSKRIPLRVALNMLKKYNEELRKLELTNTIENQLSNAPIRSNASLEVKPDVLNNGKFYGEFAENSIENTLTFSDYYGFNVDRYETYSNLYEGNTFDYYTYIPDRSNKVNPFIDPSPKKPSMLRSFAWGIAGLFLAYLLKRKIWK